MKSMSRFVLVVLSLSLVAVLAGCAGKPKTDATDYAAGKTTEVGNAQEASNATDATKGTAPTTTPAPAAPAAKK